MKKAAAALIVLLASGCGSEGSIPSNTLDASKGFQAIPGNWIERADDVYGPGKLLAYMSPNKRNISGTLMFACENGRLSARVSLGPGDNTVQHEADATIRFGTAAPQKVRFLARSGDIGFVPGSGTEQDARSFLAKVVSADEVAVQFDVVMGMASADPALLFDTKGTEHVRENLEIACKEQAAATK